MSKTGAWGRFYFVTASPACQNRDCLDAAIFELVEAVHYRRLWANNEGFLGDDLDLSWMNEPAAISAIGHARRLGHRPAISGLPPASRHTKRL
jgi:hypothetical protein